MTAHRAAIEAGPHVIRRLCCAAGEVSQIPVEAIDDTVTLVDERPVTVEMGTNALVGGDVEQLAARFHAILDGDRSWDHRPPDGIPLWDGQAAGRIAQVLLSTPAAL